MKDVQRRGDMWCLTLSPNHIEPRVNMFSVNTILSCLNACVSTFDICYFHPIANLYLFIDDQRHITAHLRCLGCLPVIGILPWQKAHIFRDSVREHRRGGRDVSPWGEHHAWVLEQLESDKGGIVGRCMATDG
jgi:hypothetical protein